MSSWKDVSLLLLLGCVVLAGVAAFVAGADYDYHYSLEDRSAERPETYPIPYERLSASKQATVDAAIGGKSLVFQDPGPLPPTVVEKDGTYYRFSSRRSFDWTDPGTAVPAAVVLVGMGGGVRLIHRDMRRNAL